MCHNPLSNKRELLIGILLLLGVYLPVIIQNENMLVTIADQLDGELLTYILQAKHVGDLFYPELFNGALKTSMTPPAPLWTVLFRLFSPEKALFLMHCVIVLSAFGGMYLVLQKAIGDKWFAMISSVLFACLPFYTVYGLSIMGQPLLFFSFYRIWSSDKRKDRVLSYMFICFFVVSSSLVLVGFADIILLLAAGLIRIRRKQRPYLYFFVGLIILTGGYFVTNVQLISSVFGAAGNFVSHRTHYYITAQPFLKSFIQIFLRGQIHIASRHILIVPYVLFTFIWSFYLKNKGMWNGANCDGLSARLKKMGSLLLVALGIALFYALFHCEIVVKFRNQLGGLFVGFQVDRIYWLYPTIWYILFGYSLFFTNENCKTIHRKHLAYLLNIGVSSAVCLYILSHGALLENAWHIYLHRPPRPSYASVEQFYQKDLFQEINRYIGKAQESYRVVNVGLYPSIALYNGFYCLDGYSNNYDFAYKNEFRQVIAKELEKDNDLKKYFDEWGNRCYVFSSEIGRQYYISKHSGLNIENLDLDYKKLADMGCQYVFSSVPIHNQNLMLEKEFERDSSYYKVFLYRLLV